MGKIDREELENAFDEVDEQTLERVVEEKINNRSRMKKTKSLRARILLISAAAALIAALVTVPIAVINAWKDGPGTQGETEPGDKTKLDDFTGYIIGKGITLKKDGGRVMKDLPANGKSIRMIADYSAADEVEVRNLGVDPGDSPVLELYAQWITSQLTFDYERHFSLFQTEIVNERFVKRAESKGIEMKEALARIRKMTEIYPFINVSVSFSLKGILDDTPGFRENAKRTFGIYGLDPEKISQALRCEIGDIDIKSNGGALRIDCDFDDVQNITFYCYDGLWFCDEQWLNYDLPLDCISDVMVGEIRKVIEIKGFVRGIGDDCILLDRQALIGVRTNDLKVEVGDYIKGFAYKGLSMQVLSKDGERVRVYAATGVPVVCEPDEPQIDDKTQTESPPETAIAYPTSEGSPHDG